MKVFVTDVFNRFLWLLGVMVLSAPASSLAACDVNDGISVQCGRTPTATFDRHNNLLVVFVIGQHVYFARSSDNGQNFSRPVTVNFDPEPVYTNGENRPKVAIGLHDEIYVSWSKVTEGRFNGDIRFTRSMDGGKSFEKTITVNDDQLLTTHRFESMQVDSAGNIFMTWIDKRDRIAAKARGDVYQGAAIYYSVSTDNGKSFQPNHRVAANSCECCRVATTSSGEEGIAIFWRHIFDQSIRDHAFARLAPDGILTSMQRATRDDWEINACPHHSPAMVALQGREAVEYHLAWFTNGKARQGVFYGRLNTLEEDPVRIKPLSSSASASHPDIATRDNNLWVVWKEFDGAFTLVKIIHSLDGGDTWKPEKVIARANDESDHPFLLNSSSQVFVSWMTNSGYALIPVKEQ